MNQVQILPVDMSVGIENKGVDTSAGKDASKGGDDFGAILAKHSVDSERGGKPGKPENLDGNNSPEEKVDSRAASDAEGENDKQATAEKNEVITDRKQIASDKENKDDEASVITVPSEKELKSEQAKEASLIGETEQATPLKTSDDVLALLGKNTEREAMPAQVDELPDELSRKSDNAIKSNTELLGDNAENTEDKANKLLTMLDEIKGISTEHVKISDKNTGVENTVKPQILDAENKVKNAVEVGETAQKVDNSTLPTEEILEGTKPSLTTDKTVIAKAVEQNIQSKIIARESVDSEEVAISEEPKASVTNAQSNITPDNVAVKAALNIGEEAVSVDEGTEQQTGESVTSKSKVNVEPTVVNAKTEISTNENKEQKVADLSVAASQNSNVKADNAKEAVESRGDSGKQAQTDSIATARASNQGSNAGQENSDNKQQSKQQPLEVDKAIVAEQKLAHSASEQVKPELETAKVERTMSPAAPVAASHATASVASAQAIVDKLTMEANPVTNVKQQTAVVDVISINRPDFSNAVKEKVMVMVNQKIRQLDIRLDPPELGSMQIKVNMQNEQAVVSFMVQNQSAKEAVEQQLSRFKEMMSESGVDVGEANVSQQQEKDQGELAEHQNEGRLSAQAEDVNEDDLAINPAQLYKASSTGVDYFV